MDGYMNKWMDGWVNRSVDGKMNRKRKEERKSDF